MLGKDLNLRGITDDDGNTSLDLAKKMKARKPGKEYEKIILELSQGVE